MMTQQIPPGIGQKAFDRCVNRVVVDHEKSYTGAQGKIDGCACSRCLHDLGCHWEYITDDAIERIMDSILSKAQVLADCENSRQWKQAFLSEFTRQFLHMDGLPFAQIQPAASQTAPQGPQPQVAVAHASAPATEARRRESTANAPSAQDSSALSVELMESQSYRRSAEENFRREKQRNEELSLKLTLIEKKNESSGGNAMALKAAQDQVAKLQSELATAQSEKEACRQESLLWQSRASGAETERVHAMAEVESTRKDLAATQATLTEVIKLRVETKQQREKLSQRDRELQQLRSDLGQYDQELQQLRSERSQRDQEIQRLREKLGQRDQEIQLLREEHGNRIQEVQRLDQACKGYEARLAALEAQRTPVQQPAPTPGRNAVQPTPPPAPTGPSLDPATRRALDALAETYNAAMRFEQRSAWNQSFQGKEHRYLFISVGDGAPYVLSAGDASSLFVAEPIGPAQAAILPSFTANSGIRADLLKLFNIEGTPANRFRIVRPALSVINGSNHIVSAENKGLLQYR